MASIATGGIRTPLAQLTRHSHTQLWLNASYGVPPRPEWCYSQSGKEFATWNDGTVSTHDVMQHPLGEWTLTPGKVDFARIVESGYNGKVLAATDYTLGPSWEGTNLWKKPTDPGLSGSGLITTGAPSITKRITAGAASYSGNLTADATSFPGPSAASMIGPGAFYPFDRVAVSNDYFPDNASFCIFYGGNGWVFPSNDWLFRFYFGGPTDIRQLYDSSGAPIGLFTGGSFCLAVKGTGEAVLFENGSVGTDIWSERARWQAYDFATNASDVALCMWIIPHGRKDITFIAAPAVNVYHYEGAYASFFGVSQGVIEAAHHQPKKFAYRVKPSVVKYGLGSHVTGLGSVRWDVSRANRATLTCVYAKPAATGTVLCRPFRIPFAANGGTITIYQNKDDPDANITPRLFRADTGLELSPVIPFIGTFNKPNDVNEFYVGFNFESDVGQKYSPTLFGYEVVVSKADGVTIGDNLRGVGSIQSVSISGADLDPTHEFGDVEVVDLTGGLGYLKERGRIPATVSIVDDAGNLVGHLMGGEVAKATAQPLGSLAWNFPANTAAAWSCTLAGEWAKLDKRIFLSRVKFNEQRDGAKDAKGNPLPWKITEVVRWMLVSGAEYVDAQVIMPDLEIRLWGTEDTEAMYTNPGQRIGAAVLRLVRDYLGMIMVWCPNSGPVDDGGLPKGAWRIFTNPRAPYTPIYTFRPQSLTAGALNSDQRSYGATEGMWLSKTVEEFQEAPECNFVYVQGAGSTTMQGARPDMLTAIYPEDRSFPYNGSAPNARNNPFYLGSMYPLVYADPLLNTQEAVTLVASRLKDYVCRPRAWRQWMGVCPLLSPAATGDAGQVTYRPLRVGDCVNLVREAGRGTEKILLRSVSPDYKDDGIRLAHFAGLVVNVI